MKTKPTKKISLTTTLLLLREHKACESGYKKLRKHLGMKWPDNKSINLLVILKNNGSLDMLWCIRATIEPYEDHRLHLCGMYADFAESVLPIYERKYPDDDRPRKAIEAIRSGDRSAAARAAYAAVSAAARAAADDTAYAATRAAGAASEAVYTAYAATRAAGAASEAVYAAYAATRARKKEQQRQAKIIRGYLK